MVNTPRYKGAGTGLSTTSTFSEEMFATHLWTEDSTGALEQGEATATTEQDGSLDSYYGHSVELPEALKKLSELSDRGFPLGFFGPLMALPPGLLPLSVGVAAAVSRRGSRPKPVYKMQEGDGGLSAEDRNKALWSAVMKVSSDKRTPSLELLRELRSVLFEFSRHDPRFKEFSPIVMRLIGSEGTSVGSDKVAAAWIKLQEWLSDLGIGASEIADLADGSVKLDDVADVIKPEGSSKKVTVVPSLAQKVVPSGDDVAAVDEFLARQRAENAAVQQSHEPSPSPGRSRKAGKAVTAAPVEEARPAVPAEEPLIVNEEPVEEEPMTLDGASAEFTDIRQDLASRLNEWETRYGAAAEIIAEDIRTRGNEIDREMSEALSLGQETYVRDVLDKLKILNNRAIREERRLFSETIPGTTYEVRLHDVLDRTETTPAEKEHVRRERVGVVRRAGERIAALKSEGRYGMMVDLRPHQWDMLKEVEKDWSLHESRRRNWHEAVVEAPTGSGKTRLMSASIELGIKNGWLDFSRKDEKGAKVVIFTHLTQIHRQNISDIEERLSGVFKERYGRELSVTSIGEGVWDYSGDIVIVSIPTVGKKGGNDKFKELVEAGPRDFLIFGDEWHHGVSAPSWKRSVGVVRDAAQKGYLIGMTATVPPSKRGELNIITDVTAVELMKTGALPPMELVQVRSGTDLRVIPTQAGDLSPGELSKSVRSKDRYERTMRALEVNGVRNDDGLASTLVRTVDRQHADEHAKYYQWYFSRDREDYVSADGSVSKSMPVRNIAVITESARIGELEALVDAKLGGGEVSFERYAWGQVGIGQRNKEQLVPAGAVRSRVDGIVAVLTDKTNDKVRDRLLALYKLGVVETLFYIGTLSEGFDGWWVQNLVGAAPTLSYIKKTQELGRLMRYGPWPYEVNKEGLLNAHRRRVAIDIVDDRSGLVGYISALRMDDRPELHERWGSVIDVASGGVVSVGYGGLRDIYDVKGNDITRKPLELPPVGEMKQIKGKRAHYLLPDSMVGAYSKALRNILNEQYRNRLDDMAFDMAVTEEELVGYLNGDSPNEERIARRMGTLLYRGRMALISSYLKTRSTEFKFWKPIEEIDERMRELVLRLRLKSLELFDGAPPSGYTNASLDRLMNMGGILGGSPLLKLYRSIYRLLTLQRGENGELKTLPLSDDDQNLLVRTISSLGRWIDIEKKEGVSPAEVKFFNMVARKMVLLYGGELPVKAPPIDKWSVSFSAARDVIRYYLSGVISSDPPGGSLDPYLVRRELALWRKDWNRLVAAVEDRLFRVGVDAEGNFIRVEPTPEEESVLKQMMIVGRGWVNKKDIPKETRGLVRILRLSIDEMASGAVSLNLGEPTDEFAQTGIIGNRDGFRLLVSLEKIFLRPDIREKVGEGLAEDYLYPAFEAVAARDNGWKPINKIPEWLRPLVALARKRFVRVWGGNDISGVTDNKHASAKLLPDLLNGDVALDDWEELKQLLLRYIFSHDRNAGEWPHAVEPNAGDLELLREASAYARKKSYEVNYKAAAERNGWLPIEQVEEHSRPLVARLREEVVVAHKGLFPVVSRAFPLHDLPEGDPVPVVEQLLKNGELRIDDSVSVERVKGYVVNLLRPKLDIGRLPVLTRDDERLVSDYFDSLVVRRSLREVNVVLEPLVRLIRIAADEKGWKSVPSVELDHPVNRLLMNGELETTDVYAFPDLVNDLYGLGLLKNGNEEARRALASAYPLISREWGSMLGLIPRSRGNMIDGLRKKYFEAALAGKRMGELNGYSKRAKDAVYAIMLRKEISASKGLIKEVSRLLMDIFSTEYGEDGPVTVAPPQTTVDLIYDFIAENMLHWASLESLDDEHAYIAPVMRSLRKAAIVFHGGDVPAKRSVSIFLDPKGFLYHVDVPQIDPDTHLLNELMRGRIPKFEAPFARHVVLSQMIAHLFTVSEGEGGSLIRTEITEEGKAAIETFKRVLRRKGLWTDGDDILEGSRPSVDRLREHARMVMSTPPPPSVFRMTQSLVDIFEWGVVFPSDRNNSLMDDVATLLRVTRETPGGELRRSEVPNDFVFELMGGWRPISDIPRAERNFVIYLRSHLKEMLGYSYLPSRVEHMHGVVNFQLSVEIMKYVATGSIDHVDFGMLAEFEQLFRLWKDRAGNIIYMRSGEETPDMQNYLAELHAFYLRHRK